MRSCGAISVTFAHRSPSPNTTVAVTTSAAKAGWAGMQMAWAWVRPVGGRHQPYTVHLPPPPPPPHHPQPVQLQSSLAAPKRSARRSGLGAIA